MIAKGEHFYQCSQKMQFVYAENPKESTDKFLEFVRDITNMLL